MVKMDDKEAKRIVAKVIWDWREIHCELSDVILYFEKTNPEAYKIVTKIAEEEARLIEIAGDTLDPLFNKFNNALLKKKKKE